MDILYAYDGKWDSRRVAHIVKDFDHDIVVSPWGKANVTHVMISACGMRLPDQWGATTILPAGKRVCKHCLFSKDVREF
jgi:hypothetical protein